MCSSKGRLCIHFLDQPDSQTNPQQLEGRRVYIPHGGLEARVSREVNHQAKLL